MRKSVVMFLLCYVHVSVSVFRVWYHVLPRPYSRTSASLPIHWRCSYGGKLAKEAHIKQTSCLLMDIAPSLCAKCPSRQLTTQYLLRSVYLCVFYCSFLHIYTNLEHRCLVWCAFKPVCNSVKTVCLLWARPTLSKGVCGRCSFCCKPHFKFIVLLLILLFVYIVVYGTYHLRREGWSQRDRVADAKMFATHVSLCSIAPISLLNACNSCSTCVILKEGTTT